MSLWRIEVIFINSFVKKYFNHNISKSIKIKKLTKSYPKKLIRLKLFLKKLILIKYYNIIFLKITGLAKVKVGLIYEVSVFNGDWHFCSMSNQTGNWSIQAKWLWTACTLLFLPATSGFSSQPKSSFCRWTTSFLFLLFLLIYIWHCLFPTNITSHLCANYISTPHPHRRPCNN